ncbi:unnamed protein product [Lepeophtheirus salmonis]|uniref:(salmon louse) hypothetical protein n=1 Tax=Lepeophtheirus salmonis TaxID=72036 RepID=A0A817FD64_LEPSM|nr:unnamed protein product [Lepeophtheirus salmonis]CAG9477910.1 unnamed protein product [Lepeophtheirus salmonis]
MQILTVAKMYIDCSNHREINTYSRQGAQNVEQYTPANNKDDDRKYQRIVWRNGDERANQKTYEWTRPIFGDKPRTDLSHSAVKFIVEKYANEYPEARRVVFEDSYTDDIVTSVESDELASKVMMDVDRVLHCGSFKIKRWYSSALSSGESCVVIPALGHNLDVESHYIRQGVRKWRNLINVKKRTILSARVWDPLGIFAPVLIELRIAFFQLLCARGIDRDTVLEEKEAKNSVKAHEQARVAEIQQTFSPELFRFVPGMQNPADALTKQLTVNHLKFAIKIRRSSTVKTGQKIPKISI